MHFRKRSDNNFALAKLGYFCCASFQSLVPTKDTNDSKIFIFFFWLKQVELILSTVSPLAHFCNISLHSVLLNPRRPRKLLPLQSTFGAAIPLTLIFSNAVTITLYNFVAQSGEHEYHVVLQLLLLPD